MSHVLSIVNHREDGDDDGYSKVKLDRDVAVTENMV